MSAAPVTSTPLFAPRRSTASPSRIPVFTSPRGSAVSLLPRSSARSPVMERNNSGVRYITEDLLLRVSKASSVESITKLNLTLSREGGKKIRYIENLEKCKALQSLNLSCNMIEKLDKLDRLVRLKELNLSHNLISRLEGIEALVSLQVLDVSDNNISVIPNWLPKRLKNLQTLRINQNTIESLTEITKLHTLTDLVQLSVADNPVCRLPHHRQFIVFHLVHLEFLDGQRVESDERESARARFDMEEVARLALDLEERQRRVKELEERQQKAEADARVRTERERELHRKQRADIERLSALERELETKDNLLKTKSDELTRACHKHYELEQELAFYKIDAKFDTLGRPPQINAEELDPVDGTGESPYIGKGRMSAVRQPGAARMVGGGGSRPVLTDCSTSPLPWQNGEVEFEERRQIEAKQRLSSALDRQLQEKKTAIDQAQLRLDGLQSELHSAETNVARASQELDHLLRASSASLSPPAGGPGAGGISEEERSQLRAALARKIGRVSRLREDAELLRCQMDETEADMRRQQADVDALHHQLARLHSSEPQHADVQRQMVDKAQQLSEQNEAFEDLQAQMDMLMETIKKEAEAVRDLENRLQTGPGENLREELEDVVKGLQDYLVNMRQQANQQRQQFDVVLRERDRLKHELSEARQEMGDELRVEKASRQDIVRRLTRLEAELEEERRANADLQAELQERDFDEEERLREAGSAERRLATAEDQIDDLKSALRRLRDEAESERAEMEAALTAERRRAAARSQTGGRDERDSAGTQREVEALRRANQQLQRQLEAQQQELLSPDDVTRQVRDMVVNIRQGKPLGANPQGDVLSRSLGELAHVLEGRGRETASGAATPGAKSDAEVQSMRSRLERAEKLEGQSDQGAQAQVLLSMIEDSKRTYSEEMTKMKDQIGRLQDALESVRLRPSQTLQLQSMLSNVEEEVGSAEDDAAFAVRKSPNQSGRAASPPRQRVFTRTRPHRGGDTSTEDEDGVERRRPALLPWKKSMYDTLSSDEQGMFEELNTELGRLRRQMETIESSNADKLEEALGQIQNLQAEIQRRDEEARAAERDRERGEWEKQLNDTFVELDQAQEQIMDLQRNLEEREREMEAGLQSRDKSNDRISLQQQEIGQLKDILEAQRQEILRLNDLLDRLSGLNPAETNRMELERIQNDISNLRASVAAQSNPQGASVPGSRFHQGWNQPSPNPLARSSPFVGQQGFPAASPQPSSYMPAFPQTASPLGHPLQSASAGCIDEARTFSASPAVGYASPHLTASMPAMAHPEEVEGHRQRFLSGERNSLICNVPEHHRLEDYLQGLQDKVTSMKRRLKEKRRMDHEAELAALRRLRHDIQEKKDELEEAQFAVERQRAAVERLQEQEKAVVEAARVEMDRIKAEVNRSRRELASAQSREAMEEAEAELEASAAQRHYLKEEVTCLQETLAQRRAELSHVEKQLAAANSELTDVKTEARETITRYDEARLGHEKTVQEAEELERRAKEALTELARTTNDARDLRSEVLELEASKRDLELTLNEIQQVIAKKDADYQALNQGVRQTAENLSKLQHDLSVTMEQGREKLDLIHEEEQLLSDKRAELEKLRQQMDVERAELEALDRLMGKRRAEAQLLGEQLEQRQEELAAVTREVEKEAGARQREIRDIQNTLDSLREEKKQLLKTIEDHKSERAQMRDDADREQQVLQNITSAISKQKMELKHLLEMIKLEQGELAKVNEQYAERLTALERGQASLHEQRAELAEVEASRKVKGSELERCREALANESAALERLQTDRRAAEASLEVLGKEKEMLAETTRGLESRQSSLKRSVGQLDENIFSAQSRLDKLQAELHADEASVSRAKAERSALEKDLSELTVQVREARAEWKSLRERLGEFEAKAQKAESEWRQRVRQRDDLAAEVRRCAEQARAGQAASEEATARSAGAKDDLQRLQHELSDRQAELQEVTKNLSRVRRDLEVEENRLNRLLSSSGGELERVKRELVLKEEELESCVSRLNQLKRETEQRHLTEEHADQLTRRCAELEAESRGSQEEKQQLAEALNRSFKERQALREELAKEREARDGAARGAEETVEELRRRVGELQREMKRVKKRCAGEVRELEQIAQQHCGRSTRLAEDLNQARHDYLQLRKQVILFGRILENASLMSQAELTEKKRRLEETLNALKRELSPTQVNGVTSNGGDAEIPCMNGSAFGELCDLQDQRKLLQSHLETLKENLNQIRGGHSESPCSLPTISPSPEQKLGALDADEELVKAQIRQRVNAHMDSLASQCRRSESNMHNLRRRLDDLEAVLGKETPIPSRDRSPFHEMQGAADVTSSEPKAAKVT